MAEDDRITLVIEGLPENEGRVRFNAFMGELQSFQATLTRLDREVNSGKPTVAFEIVELSFASPMRIAVAPKPIAAHIQVARAVTERFTAVASAIIAGERLTGFDADLLEDLRALARPVGKSIKSATVIFNGTELDFTPRVSMRLDEALAIEDECEGCLEGMLEQINIHHGANTFHIYPEVGPRKVTCHFPPRLSDDAVAAVGRRVEVSGTLKYRTGAQYPHQIAISSVVAFPPEGEIPDWEDVRGLAPDATGKMVSEDFIRELRDAWE